MDSQEKERLKKEYQEMTDPEIIELASVDKKEFQEGIYALVMDEYARRGLAQRVTETRRETQTVENETLVTIGQFSQTTEAYIIKGELESEGIACIIADDNLISINWLYSNAIGGVKLQVKRSDAEKAREIIAQDRTKETQSEFDQTEQTLACPRCKSSDIYFEKYNRKAWFWSWLLLPSPIPLLKQKWICRTCSHEWK